MEEIIENSPVLDDEDWSDRYAPLDYEDEDDYCSYCYVSIDYPISEEYEQIEMTEEKCKLLPQNENQPLRGKKKQKSASSSTKK